MGVNDPDGYYDMISSPLVKLLMQTIKTSSGDKTPPTLDANMIQRVEGSTEKYIFEFFLIGVWALQQIFSMIFGLYAIAKTIQAVEKVTMNLDLLVTQAKAKFNEENFQILDLFRK